VSEAYMYVLHILRLYILMFTYIYFYLCLILHKNFALKLKHSGKCVPRLNKYVSVYCKRIYFELNE